MNRQIYECKRCKQQIIAVYLPAVDGRCPRCHEEVEMMKREREAVIEENENWRQKMSQPKSPINEFIDGQKDCRAGKPHKPGRSKDYDSGYSVEYELEQIRTARSMQRGS